MVQPLLTAARGELPLGRSIELPRGAGREELEETVLDRRRTGSAGMGDQAEGRQVRDAHLLPVGEQALEVRGDAEHRRRALPFDRCGDHGRVERRSEEHTSELQSLMRISYAVFCLKKKKQKHENN